MSIEVVSLPSETEEFQRLIAKKDAEIARLSAHLKILQEQLNLLTAKRFGASSERLTLIRSAFSTKRSSRRRRSRRRSRSPRIDAGREAVNHSRPSCPGLRSCMIWLKRKRSAPMTGWY